ncbi:nucleotidyltransferase domain-containing protein [Rhodopseudomonas palustris]|uniref:nucleotidyltransferase family protein n=1 Tax=Rhodopseudomonas palustris TaxID=1076 RepID=UPI000164BC16|nr:nucleotidyltransferase domain-containing protein [Rhodopseudomonas palustris]ACE98839.1 DNA polymerase beta domain protein region [Rhodopseudomonas palustris TIE-1]WBU30177.1 nucleotidyltransferase domain-containing protein [Rhodopseudomonas palustris]
MARGSQGFAPETCYTASMDRRTALEILKNSEAPLRARGVRRAALFGSVTRGTNLPDSDIDVLIEIDPTARITVFDYVELKDYIAGLFDHPVDVVNRDQLKPSVAPSAAQDAIYAF